MLHFIICVCVYVHVCMCACTCVYTTSHTWRRKHTGDEKTFCEQIFSLISGFRGLNSGCQA